MEVRFWRQVAVLLRQGPGIMATVTGTSGSVPRREGARMFHASDGRFVGSVGGGAAESTVMDACRNLMDRQDAPREMLIDLTGSPGDLRDGICGGTMQLLLTPLRSAHLSAVDSVADLLGSGMPVLLATGGEAGLAILDEGSDGWTERLQPPEILLVAGAGHIGLVLAEWAARCGFQVVLHDSRKEWLEKGIGVSCRETEAPSAVRRLKEWNGKRMAVLVTRGYLSDLEILRPLLPMSNQLAFLGILGSSRRLATLREECRKAGLPEWPEEITRAPVGLSIGAQSPEEIAVSLLAQLIECRHGK